MMNSLVNIIRNVIINAVTNLLILRSGGRIIWSYLQLNNIIKQPFYYLHLSPHFTSPYFHPLFPHSFSLSFTLTLSLTHTLSLSNTQKHTHSLSIAFYLYIALYPSLLIFQDLEVRVVMLDDLLLHPEQPTRYVLQLHRTCIPIIFFLHLPFNYFKFSNFQELCRGF